MRCRLALRESQRMTLHTLTHEQNPSNAPFIAAATMTLTMQRPLAFHSLFLWLLLQSLHVVHSMEENHNQKVENDVKLGAQQSPRFLRPANHYREPTTDSIHSKNPIQEGVTFSRTIQHLNASFELQLDKNHCQSHDKFGDNHCHYNWGEQVLGNYTVTFPQAIQQGDYMTGTFHVRK